MTDIRGSETGSGYLPKTGKDGYKQSLTWLERTLNQCGEKPTRERPFRFFFLEKQCLCDAKAHDQSALPLDTRKTWRSTVMRTVNYKTNKSVAAGLGECSAALWGVGGSFKWRNWYQADSSSSTPSAFLALSNICKWKWSWNPLRRIRGFLMVGEKTILFACINSFSFCSATAL